MPLDDLSKKKKKEKKKANKDNIKQRNKYATQVHPIKWQKSWRELP